MIGRLVFIALLLLTKIARAQEIYKRTDDSGKPFYSTNPNAPNETPAPLPQIQREDLERRIEQLKSESRPLCDKRGGIDCAKGPDEDRSVICMDGYRDAAPLYNDYCLRARVQIGRPVFLGNGEERVDVKAGQRPKRIRVVIRNLSPVEAKGINVKVRWDRGETPLAGSSTIGAFGLEEYWLEELPQALDAWGLKKLRAKAVCENCSSVMQGS